MFVWISFIIIYCHLLSFIVSLHWPVRWSHDRNCQMWSHQHRRWEGGFHLFIGFKPLFSPSILGFCITIFWKHPYWLIIWRNKKVSIKKSKSGTLETSLRWTDSHDVQLHLLWISNFCSIFCFCWDSQVREEVVVEPRGLFRIKAKVGQGEIHGETCRLETVRDVVEECWRMLKVVKTLLGHRSLHFLGASHKKAFAPVSQTWRWPISHPVTEVDALNCFARELFRVRLGHTSQDNILDPNAALLFPQRRATKENPWVVGRWQVW